MSKNKKLHLFYVFLVGYKIQNHTQLHPVKIKKCLKDLAGFSNIIDPIQSQLTKPALNQNNRFISFHIFQFLWKPHCFWLFFLFCKTNCVKNFILESVSITLYVAINTTEIKITKKNDDNDTIKIKIIITIIIIIK